MKMAHACWIAPLAFASFGCTSHHGGKSEARAAPHREEMDEGKEGEEGEEMDEDEREEAREEPREQAKSEEARARFGGAQETTVLGFDADAAGSLPAGWKVEGTNQSGPLATWKVAADPGAPSASNVLALTSPNHESGGTFNLCWNDKIRFRDGSIEVSMKPVSGREDQGGGLIWRAKDKDDYYICRANPLESNFRVYYVKDGKRRQLASSNVEIQTGQWHTIRIEHAGDHIVCSLDGQKRLDVRDSTFPDEGGIGFWTKSDAASEFDDLKVSRPAAGASGDR